MDVTVDVFEKNESFKFNLPIDTKVQQIKVLSAEKLNFINNIQEFALIYDQKIINNDNTTISQLNYTPENKFILFLPRSLRSNQENHNKPFDSTSNNQPHFQQNSLPQNSYSTVQQNNNNNTRQLKYNTLEPNSPLHSLLEKMSNNIFSVANRSQPYINPWKIFLSENNTSFPDPLIQKNFEIASKLTEEQTCFVCDSLVNYKVSLAQCLDILASCSYDVSAARRMI